MGEALAALTTRGRAFLAAGLVIVVCSVLFGFGPLIAVGVLMALLPILAAALVARGHYQLSLTRTLAPARVAVGSKAQVILELGNASGTPSGRLLLEEQLPYVLGSRPRFVVDRLGQAGPAGWSRRIEYAVRSDLRGRFVIGPLSVRLNDPFGLVDLDRRFSGTSTLTVTPRVHPLPSVPLSGTWTGAGDNRPRSFASGSAEDVTVREYRRGDELRRVHWRSSAKVGELMVRREEQPWQAHATVLLDNRKSAHRGQGPASSLEYAIEAAASVAIHLVQRGFHVRLVTASGHLIEADSVLDSLAAIETEAVGHLDLRFLHEGNTGLVVAVLGDLHPADRPNLIQLRQSSASALALLLDVSQWAGTGTYRTDVDQSLSLLTATGFLAISCTPGDTVAHAWRRLGETRLSRAARVGA